MGNLADQESSAQAPRGRTRARVCPFAGLLACPFLLCGCLERTVTITSNPPGALVMLNDVEVGRTPVTTGFTYYGDYDVRLRLEGYEPLVTHRETATPFYEYAPFDLLGTAWPGRIQTKLVWNFDLTPLPEPKAGQAGLLERARQMQDTAGVGATK